MLSGSCFRPVRHRITVLATAALATLSLVAMEPPRPGELDRYRADGTLEARQAFAQSIGNHKASPALVADMHRRLAQLQGMKAEASPAPPSEWRGMPTKGTVNIFTLLIDFQDTPHSNTQETIHGRMFGDGHPAAFPYESLRNFYRRSSWGQLEIEGDTLGWYTAPYPRSSVPMSTAGRESLIAEALDHFDAQGHDFSQYDNDGDGAVDYFLVIWTGDDNGWANFWWGYQTSYYNSSYTLDGKRLAAYSWQWEANPYPGGFSPRVTIHETGHALGVPDYYDYDDYTGPQGGVGGLDQMDANRGDHNAFTKFMLDWATPTICTGAGLHGAHLGRASETGESIIAMPEAAQGTAFGEYFLIQNRTRTGNDLYFPEDGLLIWHVDSRLDRFGYNFLFDNSYTEHKMLRLMEADGLEEIERNGWGDAGDYYTAGDAFGPVTLPDSSRYGGSATGVEVLNILPGEDGSMGFDLSCSGSDPCGGTKPVITSVKFVPSTKKLKVTGTGFQKGMKVTLYGESFTTKYKNATTLKGSVQSVTKGVPVEVRVIDPATGCASEVFRYIR